MSELHRADHTVDGLLATRVDITDPFRPTSCVLAPRFNLLWAPVIVFLYRGFCRVGTVVGRTSGVLGGAEIEVIFLLHISVSRVERLMLRR